jgi:hypothetical protein
VNKNDWNIGDPEWVKAQELKWPYFEKSLSRRFDDENSEEMVELAANIKLGQDYLSGMVTELPRRGVMQMAFDSFDWILMHPKPNEANIKLIFDDFIDKGYGERLPYITKGMDISVYCEDLVSEGVVDGEVVEAFMNVVYGDCIEDTLKKNNVDFDASGYEMIGSFLGKVTGWVIRANALNENSLNMVDRWIDLSKGLLRLVKDDQVARASFSLKKFFRLLVNFEGRLDRDMQEIRLDSIPRNCEIIADLRNEMITQKKNYCPKLQEYCNELEATLIAENKI